jgi:cyclopropane-fatty-acyl-phospholipid synthase
MYSSAIFPSSHSTLEEAQFEKLDRICRKLSLTPDDHVIEIGTGWGGFAIHAAKHYGCKVTTTTISDRQHELALERVREAGLQDQITILKSDYRLLEGTYDKLVSIEMIEAVGLDFIETYFEKCSSLLKPNGEMLIQAITIQDEYYEHAKNNVDFIQRYIFPGSGIPSLNSMTTALKEKTDLHVVHLEDFGPHYARTLREWSNRLRDQYSNLIRLGYSDELYRMFQFYFSYCEGGFAERAISVMQLKMAKPESRSDSWFEERNKS